MSNINQVKQFGGNQSFFSTHNVTTFLLQGLKHAVLLKNFVLLEFDFIVMTELATDILENDILKRWPEVLRALLKDHTTNRNIFWATDMYEKDYGKSYSFKHQITVEQITGDNGTVIRPRAVKSIEE